MSCASDKHSSYKHTLNIRIVVLNLFIICAGFGCSIETETVFELKLIEGSVNNSIGEYNFKDIDKKSIDVLPFSRDSFKFYALTEDMSFVYSEDGYFIISTWPNVKTLKYEQEAGYYEEDDGAKQALHLYSSSGNGFDLEFPILSIRLDVPSVNKTSFRGGFRLGGIGRQEYYRYHRVKWDVPFRIHLPLTIENSKYEIELYMINKSRKKIKIEVLNISH